MPRTIAAGEVANVPNIFNSASATIVVAPGPGAQALIEFTASSSQDAADGNAIWAAWSSGVVSHATRTDLFGYVHDVAYADVLDGPITAIRVSSVGGYTKFDIREARQ